MKKLFFKFSQDFIILLELYEIKSGTLVEISEKLQLPVSSGKIYNMKNEFVRLKIFEPTQDTRTVRCGRGEKQAIVYKINHDAIDQIVFGELLTSKLYPRILKVNQIPAIKKRNLLD